MITQDQKLEALNLRKAGMTLQAIATKLGVSRAYVQKIIIRLDPILPGKVRDENKRKTARNIQEGLQELAAARAARRGMNDAEYKEIPNWIKLKYSACRSSATRRGGDWRITFGDWYRIWEKAGLLKLGVQDFWFTRKDRTRPYTVDNCEVSFGDTVLREVQSWKIKTSTHTGVYLRFPNALKPWVVYRGNKYLGAFATKEEAIEARRQYDQAYASTRER